MGQAASTQYIVLTEHPVDRAEGFSGGNGLHTSKRAWVRIPPLSEDYGHAYIKKRHLLDKQ
jgi:hypothetical protein